MFFFKFIDKEELVKYYKKKEKIIIIYILYIKCNIYVEN